MEIFGLLPAWLEYRVIDWEVLVELDQFLAHFERCTASGLVEQRAQLVRLDLVQVCIYPRDPSELLDQPDALAAR